LLKTKLHSLPNIELKFGPATCPAAKLVISRTLDHQTAEQQAILLASLQADRKTQYDNKVPPTEHDTKRI
jgi:hypothetical protein